MDFVTFLPSPTHFDPYVGGAAVGAKEKYITLVFFTLKSTQYKKLKKLQFEEKEGVVCWTQTLQQ